MSSTATAPGAGKNSMAENAIKLAAAATAARIAAAKAVATSTAAMAPTATAAMTSSTATADVATADALETATSAATATTDATVDTKTAATATKNSRDRVANMRAAKAGVKRIAAKPAAVAAYPSVAESGPGIDVPGTWWLGSRNTELLVLGKKLVMVDNFNSTVLVSSTYFNVESDSIEICAKNDDGDAVLELCGDNVEIKSTEWLALRSTDDIIELTSQNESILLTTNNGDVDIFCKRFILNGAKIVKPAYSDRYAIQIDNGTISPGGKIKFPQHATEVGILTTPTFDSFTLVEKGLYDIMWVLHVGPLAMAISQAAVGLYLDNVGPIAGTYGPGAIPPIATPNTIIPWSVVVTDIQATGNSPVQLSGRVVIETGADNVEISLRNPGPNDIDLNALLPGISGCNHLIIRRIDQVY